MPPSELASISLLAEGARKAGPPDLASRITFLCSQLTLTQAGQPSPRPRRTRPSSLP